MHTWLSLLHYDPLPPLLSSGDAALIHHARRELLGEDVGPPELLWGQKPVEKLLRRQQADGSWKYPGQRRPELRQLEDYDQIETYRSLGELVEKYALTQAHPALRRAAEFLFSHQTDEGDFRGIYGRQYTPNYTAAIMELLTKAGYGEDPRIQHGFRWLLSARQADGGWAIPLRTTGAKLDGATMLGPTLRTDPAKPFSHLATGVVLRAFAAHPQYRTSNEAALAGNLLASCLFQCDAYPDRGSPDFWTRFSFPFWFTDLLSALDSLSRLGIGREHPQVQRGLDWLADHQRTDGSWDLALLRTGRGKQVGLWVGLGICRVFRRLAG